MYSVSSNNREYDIQDSLREMLYEKATSDVTIVCDDEAQLSAHKLILSSHSPLMASSLSGHSFQPQTMVHLPHVSHQVVQAILQVMYVGETKISGSRYQELFEVAKELQIDSFLYVTREEDIKNFTFVDESTASAIMDDELLDSKETQQQQQQQQMIISKQPSFKNSHQAFIKQQKKANQLAKHKAVLYSCTKCDYKATQRASVKNHEDSKHNGIKYPCDKCDLKAADKTSLKPVEMSPFEHFQIRMVFL